VNNLHSAALLLEKSMEVAPKNAMAAPTAEKTILDRWR
jgi:hypothetical protein